VSMLQSSTAFPFTSFPFTPFPFGLSLSKPSHETPCEPFDRRCVNGQVGHPA
jgi:hypothetical protein